MGTLSSILSAGGSLLGNLFGFLGSGSAGRTIGNAANAGVNAISNATNAGTSGIQGALGDITHQVYTGLDEGNANLRTLLGQGINQLQPYLSAGNTGVQSLQDYANNLKDFQINPGDISKDPGYQFQLQQGQNAITNSAAAQGLNASGNALTDLTKYGEGLASTYYQNYFNNAKDTYNTNVASHLATYSPLISAGQNATSQQNGLLSGALGAGQTSNMTDLLKFLGQQELGGQTAAGALGLQGNEAASNLLLQGSYGTAGAKLGQANALSGASNSLGNILANLFKTSSSGGSPTVGFA